MRGAGIDVVTPRFMVDNGVGKLVLDWPQEVALRRYGDARNIVLEFDRPMAANLSAIGTRLPFLNSAHLDPGGRRLTLDVPESVVVVTENRGRSVIIGLMTTPSPEARRSADQASSGAEGDPPPSVLAETVTAADHPALALIRVRAGQHDPYSRIVFDWRQQTEFSVDRIGATATIVFDRPARFNLAHLARVRLRHIQNARPATTAPTASLAFTMPAGGMLKSTRVGTKVVVDVYPPGASAGQQASPPTSARGATPPAPPELARPPVPAAVTPQPASADAEAGDPGPKRLGNVPPLPIPDVQPSTAAKATVAAPPLPEVSPPSGRTSLQGDPPPQTEGNMPQSPLKVTFSWTHPVALAVFHRRDRLWIVFDSPTETPPDGVPKGLAAALPDAQRVPHEGATAFTGRVQRGTQVHASKNAFDWELSFGALTVPQRDPLVPKVVDEGEAGRHLLLPAPELGQLLVIRDPVIGDSLVVAPLRRPGVGVDGMSYPQFRIFPSDQGIALQSRIDSLTVKPTAAGLRLESAAALHMSDDAPSDATQAIPANGRLFAFAGFTGPGGEAFVRDLQALQQALVNTAPGHREGARIDLAEFYLAHRFAAETMGMADVLADARPEIVDEGRYRALRGVANFFMHRLDEAADDLAHPGLDGNAEAEMWRQAVRIASGKPEITKSALAQALSILRAYPPPMATPTRITLAEAAIASGLHEPAQRLLKSLDTEVQSPAHNAAVSYMVGLLKAETGEAEAAMADWKRLEASDDRHYGSRAKLARTNHMLDAGTLTPDEAIGSLDQLRYAWRGDRLEYDILRRLASLHRQTGNGPEALRLLRQVSVLFPAEAKADDLPALMADVFESIFVGDAGASLTPMRAVAFYREFELFAPDGARGDAIIPALAERLVAVDLLPEAAALLEKQLEKAETSHEKAAAGAEIARIRLLDGRPDEAIEVLDQTPAEGLAQPLATRRTHLRAEAMAANGDGVKALSLLGNDGTVDAERLRISIYRAQKNWVEVADGLNRILIATGADPSQPLTDLQAQTVIDLAVANSLAGNNFAVRQIYDRYAAAMARSAFADAFSLVAGGDVDMASTATEISATVEAAVNFGTQLRSQRERTAKILGDSGAGNDAR